MTGTRVYVGRISYDVRERDIEKFFKGYGRIREILLKDGFAFVEFDDHRDAEDAVYELNGKDMLGERVNVEFARGNGRGRGGRFGGRSFYGSRFSSRNGGGGGSNYNENRYGPPRNTEYRVIVENLSSRVSWQDLKDFMRQAGEVTYADAHKREKNMGIVDFATYSDMKTAIEKLDGQDLHGRRIRLHEDKSRRRRSRSRSHSPRRGRSRSRSRSRSPRSRSRSKSESDRSKSRSKSPVARGRSGGDDRDRSKSVDSRRSESSRSRSRSRSKSPVGRRSDANGSGGKNGSASRSRSRSESPGRDGGDHRSPGSRDDSRSRSPSVDGKDHSDNSRNSMDAD
ncbi:serine and arginine rich splicing factor B52 [Dermatophagoides pteronyssinus]|uniref:serine and arginine rich splicing factor B52 n=1 Tax=Dermatophagoides pteronyssinus TaxID=6956 RepID=UPI003F67BFC3